MHRIDASFVPSLILGLAPVFVGGSAVAQGQEPIAPEDPAVPEEPLGLLVNEPGAFQGYTLIAPLTTTEVLLLNMQGEVVHRWNTIVPGGGGYYLLDDGTLLHCGRENENPRFQGGGIGGHLSLFDWDGTVLWRYKIADDFMTQHHDVEPLPSGNLLVIVWEHRYREDAVDAGRVPSSVGEAGMWPDAVFELHPLPPDDAEIVWEWHAFDHLVQDADPDRANYGSIAASPGRIDLNYDHRAAPAMSDEERAREAAEQAEVLAQMRAIGYVGDEPEEEEDPGLATAGTGNLPDWMHTNAVAYHPELDLILLSSPELNEIFVIDHALSTEEASWDDGGRWNVGGDLLWRWGNPLNYGMGTKADRQLYYQHNPTWLLDAPDGELRVLVFNNGGGREDGDYSSVDELVLPFDPARGFQRSPSKPFGPTQPVWSYSEQGEFFSGFISGAQRLPNGNTLICSGTKGRVFEVTRAGKIVWEYRSPYEGQAAPGPAATPPPRALFRATRIALDHPALAGREL